MANNQNVLGRKSIKDIFLEHKLLKPDAVEKAMSEAKKTQKPLQQVVVDMKLADRVDVLQVLSKEWKVRAVDLSEMDVDPDVVKIISEQNARRHFGRKIGYRRLSQFWTGGPHTAMMSTTSTP